MREWLAGLVGDSLAPVVSVVVSTAIVILLALVIIGLAKRVFAGTGGMGGRSRAPRLAILDVSPVDPKRKLVLVRRDDTEHLLLIGGQNDLVVESGIQRVRTRRVDGPSAVRTEPEVAPEPRAPLPQRRTPPQETLVEPPVPASREVQVPARRPVANPVRDASTEPADLSITPAATRALSQETASDRTGERPLPARAPSEDRGSPPPEASAPALPAFLGVMASRPQPVVRPQTAPTPAAPSARSGSEGQRGMTQPSDNPPPPASAAPIAQPRSMATPTLPPAVVIPPRPSEPEASATPEPFRLEDEALLPHRAAPQPVRSPYQDTSPTQTSDPIPPIVPPMRSSPPVRADDDDVHTPKDASDDAPAAGERQPLSVRSFATTIQARRATPLAPPAAPASPTITAEPMIERAPVRPDAGPAQARTPAVPTDTTPNSSTPGSDDAPTGPAPATAEPASKAPAARTLTLEEEMERLLHDFTLDVSDRR
ncbi:hypothetical protein GGQ76_000862 [Aureimonas jatrophae]|uniref:Flagellar biosynthesis protein, FliO n=1 Tax=Aureimonas jatrophae TaxID=1166073 RepID=A0A1H0GIQ7_9HYPH|nr:flagellar biosynthetic protein FliO [Aureimonas jatrophae]MBB3949594.1 hypothetical protein [Aureimonas jatrophae]SDO06865.1 Flagellar biosynthesis protein, FliO [Aureimonas jatrophae]